VTTLADLPIRDDLRGRSPYGAPQLHVPVALNVNENTHPLPDRVVEEITAALRTAVRSANRYPDREFSELRHALAGYLGHGILPEQVWAANGSNEILQQLLQVFGGTGRTLMGFTPTYSMYPLLASGTGTAWIAGRRDDAFELTARTASDQVAREHPDLVVLCAPNNPTGTPLGLDVVEAVYDASDGIVIVDEAYWEFMPHGTASALTLLPGRPRLVVSRTMSKAFAFAGVRLGYLACDPAVVDALRLVRLPYHLSALTQAAAVVALDHAAEMLAVVDDIVGQRDRISRELAAMGFHPYRSGSNFVLFGGVPDPQHVFGALLEQGVLVRAQSIPGHLRVSAGTAQETSAFLSAIRSLAPASAGSVA
jgi:histidinol-phosphate aminotransferase